MSEEEHGMRMALMFYGFGTGIVTGLFSSGRPEYVEYSAVAIAITSFAMAALIYVVLNREDDVERGVRAS